MIELSKHIEMLLLENDCVVVPDLGGFIAHYQPSRYVEDEGVFLPPFRTVGFNPQLTMNDGLLVQSYMQVYHTDFPDATRRIAMKVEELKERLYQEGTAVIHGVGELHYNIRGEYEFQPQEKGILSPSLYGLDAFGMSLLAEVETIGEKAVPLTVNQSFAVFEKKKKEVRLNPHWIGRAVAVAVAAVLFFVLSIPVENTYIDYGNYASLGTDCLFDAIRSQSVATTLVGVPTEKVPQQKHLKPVAVKVEKVEKVLPAQEAAKEVKAAVAPVEKPMVKEHVKETRKEVQKTISSSKKVVPVSKKSYSIIVASLPTSADARRMLESYKKQGYADAKVVEGNGRYRIALYTYADKATAYQKMNHLKQEDAFKSAWMLSTK